MGDENKRIARNTLFLYFRMLLIMAVTLYTSRVTLRELGVDDFGIYETVAGVVTFLSFLSNALGSGTARFITFEMGKEKPRLDVLFATVRVAHIVLGFLIVIVGEIVGLWVIYNKLVIPPERFDAAVWAFHFSMVATFFQITQVPYNASIIAHEKMNIYAYISIIEAVLKLLIVYALAVFHYDKLVIYSVLMCVITVLILTIYRAYCRRMFTEVRARLTFDKTVFISVSSFSGWNLLTSSAAALANQGVTIVTDMFFSPAVVTVRTLALRINEIINQFIGNFRTAVNPQIIKKYAAGDYEGSKELALVSTKYTYYLMLILVVPLFLLVEPVLFIWLKEVPEGLVPFVRITLVQGLFQAFDTSLYVPIYANGRIKENAIISPLFDFVQLPLVYCLFKLGYPPIALVWVGTLACVALGIIVKPILVHVVVKYSYKEIMLMILRCMLVTVLALVVPLVTSFFLDEKTIKGFLIVLVVSLASVGLVVWLFGIDKQMKNFIIGWVKDRLIKRKN